MNHTYRFGLAHTRPLFKAIAAKEPRLSLHLTHVQAADQGGALGGKSVEGDNGVQPLLDPDRICRIRRGCSGDRGQWRVGGDEPETRGGAGNTDNIGEWRNCRIR